MSDEICKWPISKSCGKELPDRVSVFLACASRIESEPEPGIVKIDDIDPLQDTDELR